MNLPGNLAGRDIIVSENKRKGDEGKNHCSTHIQTLSAVLAYTIGRGRKNKYLSVAPSARTKGQYTQGVDVV